MRSIIRPAVWFVALACLGLGGCKPPPESIKVKEVVSGPPDLTKSSTQANSANRSYQLRAFHLNHIWAGPDGSKAGDGAYRAKVTVWDYADDDSPVAELYFHDRGSIPPSQAVAEAKRPYELHFPMSALVPIVGTLRNTNEPVFLYAFNGQWAIGTYVAEPVGSD